MPRNYQDPKTVQAVSDKIFSDYRERYEAHEEAEREHRENGHRNAYCIHGTYQWTDYDNICGGCEEGTLPEYWDEDRFREIARDEAGIFCADLQKRWDQVRKLWEDSEIAAKPGDWVNRKYIEWIGELHRELDEEMFRKLGG